MLFGLSGLSMYTTIDLKGGRGVQQQFVLVLQVQCGIWL